MAITLTSDPIISAADLATLFAWSATGEETYHAINSVSARFLKYTGRIAINSTADLVQTEALPPRAVPVVYLRATPVTSVTSIATTYGGAADETLTTDDYELNTTTGRLYLAGHNVCGTDYARRLVATYQGGWTTVPGDIIEAAVEQMRLDKQRRDGSAGASSVSMEGMTTSYQTGDLSQAVAEVWHRYRIL